MLAVFLYKIDMNSWAAVLEGERQRADTKNGLEKDLLGFSQQRHVRMDGRGTEDLGLAQVTHHGIASQQQQIALRAWKLTSRLSSRVGRWGCSRINEKTMLRNPLKSPYSWRCLINPAYVMMLEPRATYTNAPNARSHAR